MNKKITIIALTFMVFVLPLAAQRTYKYRISLTDKTPTPYSLNKPEEFLSRKALDRRAKQGLRVDSTDLPVCKSYIDGIRNKGVEILVTGKWNNTVTVQCSDTTLIDKIASLPYVKDTEKVWFSPDSIPPRNKERRSEVTNNLVAGDDYYGLAHHQIAIHKGDSLHSAGFRGQGMTIAVIDAGYYNVDAIKAFENTKILGTRDFVNPRSDIYEENNHGLMVLACMGTNCPNIMVGTAPEASYWLLRSEDADTEHLVEQDYWAAAVEFADSVGADVINTSLGYRTFDDSSKDYEYRNLDGKYALISRSAGMVADKGMILVCSAGNEGRRSWKKITPPADACNVITVAAIDSNLVNTVFSSVGNTADNRIKPDVAAIGERSVVIGTRGEISRANGTSFSAPTMCGLVACLWQACPQLTSKEVIELVRSSGDRAGYPDNVYGYGIPDVWKAYQSTLGVR